MAADPKWLDREGWEDTQGALKRVGLSDGGLDGGPGEKTRGAVEGALVLVTGRQTAPPPAPKPEKVGVWMDGRFVEWVVIHGSDSTGRTAEDIRRYHKSKGWSDTGYHLVVEESGEAVRGRPARRQGAHARDFNHHSYAIVLVGKGDVRQYNAEQMATLKRECLDIMRQGLPPERFIGHREVNDHNGEFDHDTTKTCPGKLFDLDAFRGELRAELAVA